MEDARWKAVVSDRSMGDQVTLYSSAKLHGASESSKNGVVDEELPPIPENPTAQTVPTMFNHEQALSMAKMLESIDKKIDLVVQKLREHSIGDSVTKLSGLKFSACSSDKETTKTHRLMLSTDVESYVTDSASYNMYEYQQRSPTLSGNDFESDRKTTNTSALNNTQVSDPELMRPCSPGESQTMYRRMLSASRMEKKFELKSSWQCPPVTTPYCNTQMLCMKSFLRDTMAQVPEHEFKGFHAYKSKHFQKRPFAGAKFGKVLNVKPSCLLLHPASQGRIVWDVMGMSLISYDMIVIPILLAFSPDSNWFTALMGWVTLLFWSCDMIASVNTGYYEKGDLVMKRTKIVRQYLKGWFWIDCMVVLPDWVMKVMQGSTTSASGLARVLRVARVMRVLRLLRLLKLKRLFTIVYDLIDSEVTFIIFGLFRMLTIIVFMNHVVACAWYGVGALSKEAGTHKNWLEDVGMTPVYNQKLSWRYLTSLHWSITQFTPASMDVSATNDAERLFSIVILFWALVALSSIIGSVSASMTALRNMSADENKNMWVLRRYLKQQKIRSDLTQRIFRYVEFQFRERQDVVTHTQVKLLASLSEQFQAELQYEMNSHFLRQHPFLDCVACNQDLRIAMHRLCFKALTQHPTAEGQVLFNAGDEGRQVYFVRTGCYEYTTSDGNTLDTLLEPRLWTAEAVLWTDWRHRGWMRAQQVSETLMVSPKIFAEIFSQHPQLWLLAMHYGTEFVKYLNSVSLTELSDVILEDAVFTCLREASSHYESEKLEQIEAAERNSNRFKSTRSEDTFMAIPEEPKYTSERRVSIEECSEEYVVDSAPKKFWSLVPEDFPGVIQSI